MVTTAEATTKQKADNWIALDEMQLTLDAVASLSGSVVGV
jgi:hypothetical protein